MGLLHDKGKEQLAWQEYIQSVTEYKRVNTHLTKGPNHSYVGAVIARKLYPQITLLIGNPIAGHHRGHYDYCDYLENTKTTLPDDIAIDEKCSKFLTLTAELRKIPYLCNRILIN